MPSAVIFAGLVAWLAFAQPVFAQARAELAYLAVSDGSWQVWVAATDGSGARAVTQSPSDKTRVSWYPDGQRLLVNGADGRLYRVEIASGKEALLETPLTGMADAALSPDGTLIAFSLGPAGDLDANEIWRMTESGGDLRKLTQLEWMQHEPAWSPDGRQIFFLTGPRGRSHDIWRLDLASGKKDSLTAGSGFHFDVAVSRGGEIAYSSNRGGNYDLFRQRDQKQPTRLTDDPALDGRPTWSPDGKWIVFESMRGGVQNLWKIEVGDGERIPAAVPVTQHAEGARMPIWYAPPKSEGSR